MTNSPEDQHPQDESQLHSSSVVHGVGMTVVGLVEGNPAERDKTIENLNAEIEPHGLKIVSAETEKTELQKSVDRLTAMGLDVDKDRIEKAAIIRRQQRRRP